jgi:gas vesicle protein
MTTTTKVILGLIGAAAVGAAVGMLFAPEKGSDLRKNIKDKAGKWTEDLTDLWNNTKENVKGEARKVASRTQSEI